MSTRLLGALAAFAATLPVVSLADTMDYSYAEIAYLNTDLEDDDGLDGDGNGFGLKGSIAIQQTFFAFVEYQTTDLDLDIGNVGDADASLLLIGGGAHWPINDKLDIVGRIGFANAEIEVDATPFGDFEFDDDGFLVGARLRATPFAKLELEGGLEYRDLDDFGDDTLFLAEGRYFFLDNLAGGLQLEMGDDVTTIGINLRLTF